MSGDEEGLRIAAWFEDWFEPSMRAHGATLVENEMVEVLDLEPRRARGEVDFGKGRHAVEVGLDLDDRWEFACSCEGFGADRRCPHVWALLVELEAVARANALSGRPAEVEATRAFFRNLILSPPEIETSQGTPVPVLDASALPWRLAFEYGDTLVEPGAKGESVLSGDAVVVRDLEAEASWLSRLEEPGPLSALLGEVEAAGGRAVARTSTLFAPRSIDLELVAVEGGFELRGRIEYAGGTATAAALGPALGGTERYVDLGPDRIGLVPDRWLDEVLRLARPVARGDALRFGRSEAFLLDALAERTPGIRLDERFAEVRRRLASAAAPAAVAAPEGFGASLRPYQEEGLGWLLANRAIGLGACLADDMGLGKTVQVLASLFASRGAGKPSLVVAPRSVADNWIAEARRFWPGVRVARHLGPDRRLEAGAFEDADLAVTSYGLLRRDADFLASEAFDTVVLDEAQVVKNPASRTAIAARRLVADHRLALTGTPIENRLEDLASILEFLMPGLFGRPEVLGRLLAEDPAALARALRPFLLRRTKAAVAKDLPPRTEQVLLCDLPPAQADRYREVTEGVLEDLRAGRRSSGVQLLEILLRLRQAACHPGLVDPGAADESSAKFEVLVPMLEEIAAEGNKALVFSQFTAFLALLRPRLEAAGLVHEYLDGSTRDRKAPIDRFTNDPECRLFLISLKAGGVGLNLTAAGYVFLLDPWWNPAVEAQAIDRAHRIGQTQPVFAYRLVARGTIEEKILELQSTKRDLAEAVLGEDPGPFEKIDLAAIERLVRG